MQRSQMSEDPRTRQSQRGSSEAVSAIKHPSEGSSYIPSLPSSNSVFVWDLLDGKSESDAQFRHERATRELQHDAYEKMGVYGLHPMEYLDVCREAVAREREDWRPSAEADLIQNTGELIGVLDKCPVKGTDGMSEVSVTQLVADNATDFDAALVGILEAVNGYLRQHYRITAETVVGIANNILADQCDPAVVKVDHPAWCDPSQCHMYDNGESVVHRREFRGFTSDGSNGIRLFTVSQCHGEARPVIPDLDAGDFEVEEIPELARVLLRAYEHMTGKNPIEALMSEGGTK